MGLLTDHEGEPVTFLLRGTFAPQYFGAIALEPLFDLGGIGITSRRHRQSNRFDGLAGQRPTGPDEFWVCKVWPRAAEKLVVLAAAAY